MSRGRPLRLHDTISAIKLQSTIQYDRAGWYSGRFCYLHPDCEVVQLERGERLVQVHLQARCLVSDFWQIREVRGARSEVERIVTPSSLRSQLKKKRSNKLRLQERRGSTDVPVTREMARLILNSLDTGATLQNPKKKPQPQAMQKSSQTLENAGRGWTDLCCIYEAKSSLSPPY